MRKRAWITWVALMLMLVGGFVLYGHTVDITSVAASPSPGTITVNNIGAVFFNITVHYTASGFDPDDRMCFLVELCKNSGGCGTFNDCIEVTGPSGSGSVSATCGTGGPGFKDYCGNAYLRVIVMFYDADYGPPVDGDTYTVSGYTVDCDCSYSLSSYSSDYSCASGSGSFNVSTQSGCPWTATPSQGWVSITSGSSGTGNGTVSCSVDTNPGSARSATISVGDQFYHINQDACSLPSPTPHLSRSPSSLDFGTSSTSKPFSVWNDDGGTLTYTITDDRSWMSVDPTSGSSTGEHDAITVTVNRSGLDPGTYTGTVTIDPNSGSNQTVAVTICVPDQDPVLSCSTRPFRFGSTFTRKTFEIENTGGGTLTYSISADEGWIKSISPDHGSLGEGKSDTITVRIDRDKLQPGSNSATLSITSNDESCSVSVSAEGTDPDPCSANQAPSVATPVNPPHSSTAPFPPELRLEWECSDPDGDTLTYKAYLHTDYSELSAAYRNPDELAKYLVATTSNTFWAPPSSYYIIQNASYYWSIISSDGCSETRSGIFIFRTESSRTPPYGDCWLSTTDSPIGFVNSEHSCTSNTGVIFAGADTMLYGGAAPLSAVGVGAYAREGSVQVNATLRGVFGSTEALTSVSLGYIVWKVYGPIQEDGTADFVMNGERNLGSPIALEDFVSPALAAAGLKTGADIFESLSIIADWVLFASSLSAANSQLERLQDSDSWDSHSISFSFQAPESGTYAIYVGVKVSSTSVAAGNAFFLGQVENISVGK